MIEFSRSDYTFHDRSYHDREGLVIEVIDHDLIVSITSSG